MNRTTIRTVLLLVAFGAMTYSSLFTSDSTLELLLIATALILFLIAVFVDPAFRKRLAETSSAPFGPRKPIEPRERNR